MGHGACKPSRYNSLCRHQQRADGIIDEDSNETKVLLSYWNSFAFSNPESQRRVEVLEKIPFHATIETHASETAWFSEIILQRPITSSSAGDSYGPTARGTGRSTCTRR